jgi:HSP20 family protein
MNNPIRISFLNDSNANSLNDLRREMDHFFDHFWKFPVSRGSTETHFVPACDVEEEETHYLLTLEMPGISKDDVKVEILEDQMIVSGERKLSKKSRESGNRYTERRFGKFQRSFALPLGIDSTKIEANYQDGILHLFVPKAEAAKPRQIRINAQSESGLLSKYLGQAKTEKGGASLSSEYKAEKIA